MIPLTMIQVVGSCPCPRSFHATSKTFRPSPRGNFACMAVAAVGFSGPFLGIQVQLILGFVKLLSEHVKGSMTWSQGSTMINNINMSFCMVWVFQTCSFREDVSPCVYIQTSMEPFVCLRVTSQFCPSKTQLGGTFFFVQISAAGCWPVEVWMS